MLQNWQCLLCLSFLPRQRWSPARWQALTDNRSRVQYHLPQDTCGGVQSWLESQCSSSPGTPGREKTAVINNNNNCTERCNSRFFTISSQCHELYPTWTLKWPGHNRVQVTCNTPSCMQCHWVWRDSSAIKFDRVEIAFILVLFYCLKPLTDEDKTAKYTDPYATHVYRTQDKQNGNGHHWRDNLNTVLVMAWVYLL